MFLCSENTNSVDFFGYVIGEKRFYSGMKILRQCGSKALNQALDNVKCYSSPDCSFKRHSFLN